MQNLVDQLMRFKLKHSSKLLSTWSINDDEQITINTLIQKMAEYIDDIDIQPYGFFNKIIIAKINGRPNVVTFWSTATALFSKIFIHNQKIGILK